MGVSGVLTYEDVTNVDSIGIVTARSGVHVGAGVGATIYDDGGARFSGVVTATSFSGNLSGTPTLGTGVTITSSGMDITGIATISGAAKVGGGVDITAAGSGVFYTPGQSTAAGINFHDSDLRFFTSNTERFRITSGGNLDTINGTQLSINTLLV